MRLAKLCTFLISVSLSSCFAVAEEIGQSIIVHDAGNTYQMKESLSDGSLVLSDNDGEQRIGQCEQRSIERVPNQASGFIALIFVRDCGATTDFATHAAIENSTGTVKSIAVFAGKPKISARWTECGFRRIRSVIPSQAGHRSGRWRSGGDAVEESL